MTRRNFVFPIIPHPLHIPTFLESAFCLVAVKLLNTSNPAHQLYTCKLFLRYKREIVILGVLGFLKTTRSFPKIPEEVRSLPRKSEVFRRRPKSSKDVRSLPKAKFSLAFHFKNQRSRRRYCHLFILHMVFVPYMVLS